MSVKAAGAHVEIDLRHVHRLARAVRDLHKRQPLDAGGFLIKIVQVFAPRGEELVPVTSQDLRIDIQ